ncbi:hypothetical protein V2J09_012914 [Rumex salicifolius]
MEKDLADDIHAAVSESVKINLTPKASGNKGMMPKPEIILELLKRLDSDIVYSSEKLLNLDLCISDMSLGENDPRVFSMEKGSLSDEQSEKTLALDLSLSYLGSEVIELGNFLDSLQVEVVNVYNNITLFESEPELASLFKESLRSLETSLKPLQQKLHEMKKQLGILQRIRSFGQNSCKSSNLLKGERETYTYGDENDEVSKSKMEETPVSSELDLDRKLAEFKKNEDELKLKLLMAEEEVSSTWLRLLEAENLAEIFKGIGSEMISRMHVLQFSLNGSLQREAELKGVKKEETTDTYLSQVNSLKENVKLLEEKLENSESMLRKAIASKEDSDQTIFEMENFILSMRENSFAVESRAEEAEAKVAELTETNIELNEELAFLKGSDSNTEKISLLEIQVRDLEKKLQHAKASSEASLKKQNLLYAAIWDMETLIADLNSKASKAEVKSEATEDKCLKLAESNSELNKEISCLKSRAETLEASLNDISTRKGVNAKEINVGTKVIADMVMQLAVERERIQKQLYSLARENRILMEELRKYRKKSFDIANCIKECNGNDSVKDACSSMNDLTISENDSVGVPENQVNESFDFATSNENDEDSSTSPNNTNDFIRHENARDKKQGNLRIRRGCTLMAVLVLVLSAGAMLIICTEEKFAALQQCIGL